LWSCQASFLAWPYPELEQPDSELEPQFRESVPLCPALGWRRQAELCSVPESSGPRLSLPQLNQQIRQSGVLPSLPEPRGHRSARRWVPLRVTSRRSGQQLWSR